MDIDKVKRLSAFMDERGLEELELEDKDTRIMIKKGLLSSSKDKDLQKDRVEEEKKSDLFTFRSPLVGIFYRGAEEGAPPYVKIGDTVKRGNILCNIRVIGITNPIKSDLEGEVMDILVENKHPVEYGQGLFVIKKKETLR